MDLALPRFEGLGDRLRQVNLMNLDALSSDDMEGSVGLSNLSVTVLCDLDEGHTFVNLDQVLSDEDLPPMADSVDRRQVVQIRDVMYRLWTFLRSVGNGIPDGQCGVRGTQGLNWVSGCHYTLAFRPQLRVARL